MKKIVPLLIGILIFVVGCSHTEFSIYQGRDLTIGVIGAIPDIKEKNIDFQEITFEELKNNTESLSNELDAIMIMKEFLHEADDDQYVDAYKTLKIPTFFMQSTKVHVPFVNAGVQYDDMIEVDPANFAAGFLNLGTDQEINEHTWRYQLQKNQNIQDVYAQIFATIESVSSRK